MAHSDSVQKYFESSGSQITSRSWFFPFVNLVTEKSTKESRSKISSKFCDIIYLLGNIFIGKFNCHFRLKLKNNILEIYVKYNIFNIYVCVL